MNIEHFEKGVNCFKNERWKDAYDIFSKLYNENSEEQNIYPYLAYCAIKINQIEQVNYFLQIPFKNKILSDINDFFRVITINQWQEIEEALKKDNINIEGIVKLNFLYSTVNAADRVSSLLNYVTKNPEEEFWFNLLIYNSFHSYNSSNSIPFSEIRSCYNKCVNIYPNYSLLYYTKACFSTELPNGWVQLFELLDKAIELNPNYAKAYALRSEWYYDEERFEESLLDCKKAISAGMKRELEAIIYRRMGRYFYELDKYFDSVMSYNKALDIDSTMDAYYDRGLAKRSLNDYRGALIDFEFAIKTGSVWDYIIFLRGEAKFHTADYVGSIKDLSGYIEAHEEYYPAYGIRAKCYKALNELKLAEIDKSTFEKLKAIDEELEAFDNEDEDDD